MQTIHRYLKNENVDSELSIKVSNYLEYLYKVYFIFFISLNIQLFYKIINQESNEV